MLESVQEYIEEGQALHHCVFTNEYHLKEKSLILSASIDGKPIEAIELSLETMEVLQCRGLMNQNTEYHEHIIELTHRNIKEIQSRVAQIVNSNPENSSLEVIAHFKATSPSSKGVGS